MNGSQRHFSLKGMKVSVDLHQFSCFPAILISTMLEDLNAQEKDTVTFEVNINYEEITYKWLKNGVEIRSTDRCQARCKQLNHTLSIRNVHFGDSAEYTFMAGSAGTTAKLYVEGKIFSWTCRITLITTRTYKRTFTPSPMTY